MKNKISVFSSIDIGSHNIRMLIVEVTKKGEVKTLEELRHYTDIGKDTFSYGKVSIDTIHQTCNILKKYSKMMEEYRVKDYRAVATSGIREATNRAYIIELIRMRTGLKVEIINSAEERFFTFKAIRSKIKHAKRIRQEGSLIVNIGSGGVEISAYKHGNLRFTTYVKIGALRLREILSDIQNTTLDFPIIMNEYIESKTYLINGDISSMKIKNFIGLGGGITNILKLCNYNRVDQTVRPIKKEDLNNLYNDISKKSMENTASAYKITFDEAQTLLPSIIILKKFLNLTKADSIIAPMVSLRHGIIADMVDSRFDTPRKKDFTNDIITATKFIGQRYKYDEKHAEHVEYLATLIFDQLKRIHKLADRERLYLQVSSLLHDIGKFINLDSHNIYTYKIIMAINLMGFSTREVSIIANVARYHSDDIPQSFHANYNHLAYEDRIIISKLSAILKLADALDICHVQKVKYIDIKSSKNNIDIIIDTPEDIILEKWSFKKNADFFEEVLGIKIKIKHKGGYN